jgi:septum formation protein
MELDRERWILASASPRRRELLAATGQIFDVEPSGVDEGGRRSGESPRAFAVRLAETKAEEVARRHPRRWVLGADTVVVAGDVVLGKPIDSDEARGMLAMLSGREHRVITAFALADPSGRVASSGAVETRVVFRELSSAEIDEYVASGEPADKAGAYAIQGGAAGFVSDLSGSYSNVIGLPLEAVETVLRAAGLWREPTVSRRARA